MELTTTSPLTNHYHPPGRLSPCNSSAPSCSCSQSPPSSPSSRDSIKTPSTGNSSKTQEILSHLRAHPTAKWKHAQVRIVLPRARTRTKPSLSNRESRRIRSIGCYSKSPRVPLFLLRPPIATRIGAQGLLLVPSRGTSSASSCDGWEVRCGRKGRRGWWWKISF